MRRERWEAGDEDEDDEKEEEEKLLQPLQRRQTVRFRQNRLALHDLLGIEINRSGIARELDLVHAVDDLPQRRRDVVQTVQLDAVDLADDEVIEFLVTDGGIGG